MPPTDTDTAAVSLAAVFAMSPGKNAGVVLPKPVAYITTMSPGFGGTEVGIVPSPMIAVPAALVAATLLPLKVNRAGANACCVVTTNGSLRNSLGPLGLAITTTEADAALVRVGAWKLIWSPCT